MNTIPGAYGASMAAIRALFPEREVSRFGVLAWPPPSPVHT